MTVLKTIFIVLAALESANIFGSASSPQQKWLHPAFVLRGGSSSSQSDLPSQQQEREEEYGRLSDDYFRLTPDQIAHFRREGCVTIDNVLTDKEVDELQAVFDKFISGEIHVPGKDFCDMSKPFGTPYEEWSIVNCKLKLSNVSSLFAVYSLIFVTLLSSSSSGMLPTKYHPEMRGNIFERLTASIVQQLFDDIDMVKLNKRPGKDDAVFAWHQGDATWLSHFAHRSCRSCITSLRIILISFQNRHGLLAWSWGLGCGSYRDCDILACH